MMVRISKEVRISERLDDRGHRRLDIAFDAGYRHPRCLRAGPDRDTLHPHLSHPGRVRFLCRLRICLAKRLRVAGHPALRLDGCDLRALQSEPRFARGCARMGGSAPWRPRHELRDGVLGVRRLDRFEPRHLCRDREDSHPRDDQARLPERAGSGGDSRGGYVGHTDTAERHPNPVRNSHGDVDRPSVPGRRRAWHHGHAALLFVDPGSSVLEKEERAFPATSQRHGREWRNLASHRRRGELLLDAPVWRVDQGDTFCRVDRLRLGCPVPGHRHPQRGRGVGALLALILVALLYRPVNPRNLMDIALETTRTSTMILMIVAFSTVLGQVLSFLNVPQELAQLVADLEVNRWVVFVIMNLLFLFLGFFIPPVAIILVIMPVLFPIITELGFDPVWFGVVMTLNMEMGLITPPVGLNLYVVQGIAPDIPLRDILAGSLPYVGVLALGIVILALFPGLVTWLPNQTLGG